MAGRLAVAAGASVFVLLGLIAWSASDVVTRCDGRMVREAMPSDWQSWPRLPIDSTRLNITGETSPSRYAHRFDNARLVGRRPVCTDEPISLRDWYEGTSVPMRSYAAREECGVRKGPDERYVVACDQRPDLLQAEHPLAAVRIVPDRGFGFDGSRPWLKGVLASAALVIVIALGLRAKRARERADELDDHDLWLEGTSDGKGSIQIAGAAAVLRATAPLGHVLVRLTGADAGTYRDAPTLEASEVVSGTRGAVVDEARLRGEASAKLVVIVAVLAIVVAFGWGAVDLSRAFYFD